MEVSMIEWVVFFAIVAILLFLDLFVIHRKNEHIPVRSALLQTAIWVSIALAFGVYVFLQHGADHAMEFYAAYVVEEAMSVDNLFVFILLFSMFGIKDEMQHKALFYGIIGAIVFRAIFIFVGSELLNRIDWMMYIFGILLVFLAFKTAFQKKDESKAPVAEWLSKHMNVSSDLDGGKFFTIENGKKIATPLLVCVLAIELTDIMFAIDSVPACLSITQETFLVYTSNIFAIMGLRSLYFAIHGSLESLRYMKYGLAAILLFVGFKMLVSNFYHVDVVMSLGVILGVLAVTVLASVLIKPKEPKTAAP